MVLVGSGGSIPIVSALARSVRETEPRLARSASETEPRLVGKTDENNIPGPTERVRLDEFDVVVITEAKSVREFAAGDGTARRGVMSQSLECADELP